MKKYIEEFWKDISGYEGLYQVSNLGRVKSFKQDNINGKILKPSKNSHGYLLLNLFTKNIKKHKKTFYIHRLLMLNFRYKEYFEGANINHIDGNKLNNNLDNLEWCTQKENIQHSVKTGLQVSVNGENHGNSKLIEIQVRKIRFYYENKIFNQYELAKMFNVKHNTISNIVNNKIWLHIL